MSPRANWPRRGFWTSSNPDGANIWRFADRVFVGEAASKWAGNSSVSPDAGTSWFSQDADGPSYLGVNAVLLSISRESNVDGRYAIVGVSKVSALTPAGGIGVAGAIINSKAGGSGWALYSDVQHENTGWSSGLEVAAKNASGVDLTATPYTDNNGVYGVWLAGGGDNSYGPAATNPSNAALVVLKNATTWNSGVVFKDDGLTGTDGTSGSTGTGIAIAMARRHAIRWYEPTNSSTGAQIVSSVTATANKVGITLADGQVQFIAPNDAVMGAVIASGTVANYVGLTGVATGSAASVSALGSDSNIDLAITPKGTGNLKFGTHTASGDAAVSGYITIKDAAGNTRKLATIA